MVLASPRQNVQGSDQFLQDTLEGLHKPQKTLPCKYLYNEAGSKLFESICELEDYYLTRVEAKIFAQNFSQMADRIGPKAIVLEPGAGNCAKAKPLLAALQSPLGYIPIDISSEIFLAAQKDIRRQFPGLRVQPIVGDFTQPEVWRLLRSNIAISAGKSQRRVIFFPGSTIGNFSPEQAQALLNQFRQQLNAGDGLLIGTDLVKDSVVLERAYHDSEHVTEKFNKNLLHRINDELEGDFNTQQFAHRAFYHPLRQRIEMHLVSLIDQRVFIAGNVIEFCEGETIHTENSYKYSCCDFYQLLRKAGFEPCHSWTDDDNYYAIHYAKIT